MVDVVSAAMLVILPVLTYSIYQARRRQNYPRHKSIQVITFTALLIVVGAFEVQIRLQGWTSEAEASPYYDTILFPVLYVHLFFAVSTFLLWGYTTVMALVRIPDVRNPSSYRHVHRRWGWVAASGMYVTAVTGWTFHYLAFVAG